MYCFYYWNYVYFVDLCGICLSFILYMCLDCELYCVIHFVIHIHTTLYYFEIDLLYIYIYTHICIHIAELSCLHYVWYIKYVHYISFVLKPYDPNIFVVYRFDSFSFGRLNCVHFFRFTLSTPPVAHMKVDGMPYDAFHNLGGFTNYFEPYLPSGKHTKNYWKLPFRVDYSFRTVISIGTLVYQRVGG